MVLAVSPGAQTFGRRIYFAENRSVGNTTQLIGLAHEMLHVWQYERMGRDMRKYCKNYTGSYFDHGMDYYAVDMEQAAYGFESKFANWLMTQHNITAGGNYNGGIFTYNTASPYQRRTSAVPSSLFLPPQLYAVVCLTNPSDISINYSYRWDRNGKFFDNSVPANGGVWWHSKPLEGGIFNTSQMEISFDETMTPDNNQRRFDLKHYVSAQQNCDQAKRYTFSHDATLIQIFDSGN
jgi:hypothetical protein